MEEYTLTTEVIVLNFLRILPNIVVLILFCTYVLPYLGSGPLWPTAVVHHSELCKKYMWRNMMFVHNYFGFENMCLTHTHQVGIDMQLFLFTPLVVFLIWKSKVMGLTFLFLAALVSTFLRFSIAYKNELSGVIYFGIPISKMFQIANLSYILPTHRASIYLIGVLLAFVLRNTKQGALSSLSMLQKTILWAVFLVAMFATWLGPYEMAKRNYVFDRLMAARINAYAPVIWGLTWSFAIFVMNRNTSLSGIPGKIMCWKYFQFGTKIAYSLYLVQFPIYFYNVGRTKHVDEYRPHYLLDVLETGAIVMASIVLTLLVEMPFQNMKKVLFDRRKEYVPTKDVNLARKELKSG